MSLLESVYSLVAGQAMAYDQLGERGRSSGAHALVDVAAIRLAADAEDVRAQRLEQTGRDGDRGAMGAVDDDLQPFQRQALGKTVLDEFDVAAAGILAPLSDAQVEYTDGSPATVAQYSRDVAAFLMWAAEPKLEQRKSTGFRVIFFLVVLAGLFYFTKKKIWSRVEGHH